MPRSEPTLPPVPNYDGLPPLVGSTDGSGAGSTRNPMDRWGLGALYGVPIYQGQDPGRRGYRPPTNQGHKDDPRVGEGQRDAGPVYTEAQDIITGIYNQWARGTAGDRQSFDGYLNIQKMLYYAGYFGQTSYDKIHAGQWTPQTQNALVDALTAFDQAQKAGVPLDFNSFLEQNAKGAAAAGGGFYGEDGAGGSGGGGGGRASGPTLADSETLRLTAQEAAQSALARNLTPDELTRFVDQFHQAQITAFNTAAGGGSPTDADPRAEAIRFVVGNHGKEYQQNQIQDYTNAFLNLFLPGESQRPDLNIDPTFAGA